jgi:uncharacterized protein with PIN domain
MNIEQRPQPYYDIELGRICRWLKEHGYTMHVKLNGDVELRKKTGRPSP